MKNEYVTLREILATLNFMREQVGQESLKAENMMHSLRNAKTWKPVGKIGVEVLLDKEKTIKAYAEYLQKRANYKRAYISKEKAMQQGLYTASMLFGAINALRKLNGNKLFKTPDSLKRALSLHFQPVAETTGSMNTRELLYEPQEIIEYFTTQQVAKGNKTQNYLVATEADLLIGGWVTLALCEKLTGVKRKRISELAISGAITALLHPETGDMLFNVTTVAERANYRTLQWLKNAVGEEKALELLKTRKTEQHYNYTIVYVPELRHL